MLLGVLHSGAVFWWRLVVKHQTICSPFWRIRSSNFLLKLHVIFRSCSASPHVAPGRIDYQYLNCLVCDVFTWKPSCCAEVSEMIMCVVRFGSNVLTRRPLLPSAGEWKHSSGLCRLVYRNQKTICEGITQCLLPFTQTEVGRSHFVFRCLFFSPVSSAESSSDFLPWASLGKICFLSNLKSYDRKWWSVTPPPILPLIIKPVFSVNQ